MSIVGAIIGGSVGFVIGQYYISGTFGPLLLALIGSVLGSILFNYLVKIALALIAAGIPAILAYYAVGGNAQADQTAQDTPVIIAILVLLVVFAIAYYLVEELIGIVTALVGGFLLGAGVFLLTGDTRMAIAAGGIVFLVGAILQTLAVRAAKKGAARLRKWRRTPLTPTPPPAPTVAYNPPTPPPPPPTPPPRYPDTPPPPLE